MILNSCWIFAWRSSFISIVIIWGTFFYGIAHKTMSTTKQLIISVGTQHSNCWWNNKTKVNANCTETISICQNVTVRIWRNSHCYCLSRYDFRIQWRSKTIIVIYLLFYKNSCSNCHKIMLKLARESAKLPLYLGASRFYSQLLYTQGQRVDKKIREYFYYIDHDGMVCNILPIKWKSVDDFFRSCF